MWGFRHIWGAQYARKSVTEHRGLTLRLFLSGFILNDIPVLYENAIFNANNIGRDPVSGCSESGKASMCDHDIPVCDNHAGFVS
jgi:hypothetical protein